MSYKDNIYTYLISVEMHILFTFRKLIKNGTYKYEHILNRI